jgi:hypothetical protein
MDDTRELIPTPVFSHWLIVAAGVILLGGLAVGWAWGRRNGAPRAGLARGLAAGLCGPAALGLWEIYNALEDHFGLDSVAALLINLLILLIAGAAAGAVFQRVWRATAPEGPGEPSEKAIGETG